MSRFVAVVVVIFLSMDVAAYRPSATSLLFRAAALQRGRDARTLVVLSEASLPGLSPGAVDEKLVFLAPSSTRLELGLPGGRGVLVRTGEQTRVHAGNSDEEKRLILPQLISTFFTTSPPLSEDDAAKRLLAACVAIGVDTTVVSLARFDGRIAWLIGSKPWEENKSQIWLDKEQFLLLRVVQAHNAGKTSAATEEVRLLGYGSAEAGNWFPKTVEILVAGELVRHSVVRSVEKNVVVAPGLFKGAKG